MFYEPGKTSHGLGQDPFKSCVVPRPIGWISTKSPNGADNLAPYSQFQNLTFDPPYVMVAINQKTDGTRKNTTANIETTGEFVYNMVPYALKDAMNRSAAQVPLGTDKFALAGVTPAPARLVKASLVAESPVQFECVYHSTLRLPCATPFGTTDILIGRVVAVHIKDEFIRPDGRLDIAAIRPLARMGYADYTAVEDTFELTIPTEDRELMRGLRGQGTGQE